MTRLPLARLANPSYLGEVGEPQELRALINPERGFSSQLNIKQAKKVYSALALLLREGQKFYACPPWANIILIKYNTRWLATSA